MRHVETHVAFEIASGHGTWMASIVMGTGESPLFFNFHYIMVHVY